ncbi:MULTISPECIES: YicC/YloC family endoribonuclease [Clostridia]|uniref:YicC/YloC family endoribonuclease n=1 Tax=Clostridia TaxID=186801 RepID=UPI000EA385A3|nr:MULTISPECIES: YicC/YloC family endoribonuclease [Clostridia]NBJ68460.1 YicC family protein [Roseburia sp. 1XD42-34]RKI81221.1 YicC family protein [Clostridium sp. 1xD42-85]
MVISMTGYGSAKVTTNQLLLTVEVKTVNHRYLDISMKLPNQFGFLEEKLKKMLQSYFQRGRVELYIQLHGEALMQKTVETNWDLVEQYMTQLQEMKERYQLAGELPITIITGFPDVFSVSEIENELTDAWTTKLKDAVNDACQQALEMRKQEGTSLSKDLQVRIHKLQQCVEKISARQAIALITYRERIQRRVADHFNEEPLKDPARLYQEIVLLAEKGDITEEITRMNSHLAQMKQTLLLSGTIGRKLEFIAQELLREANTIGSKSVDTITSEYTINIKSEIEKIKEQVQNVE